ncbi:MAG: YbgC/FadM family acyl-CoA thioesterase [Alphaproteobacteria bacterium]
MGAPSGIPRGGVHIFPVRVYFEDTDAAGIVYYANYLKFAERARTEMMRALGHAHSAIMRESGVAFSVRRCEAEYLLPARLDDLLEVRSRVLESRGASMWMEQRIYRGTDEIARLVLRLAGLRPEGGPARLPADLRAALAEFASGDGSARRETRTPAKASSQSS